MVALKNVSSNVSNQIEKYSKSIDPKYYDYAIRVNNELWGWVDGKENAEKVIDNAARELVKNETSVNLFIKRDANKPEEVFVMRPGWFYNYVQYHIYYEPIHYIQPKNQEEL